MKGMRNVEESVNVKKKWVWFYKEIFIYLYLFGSKDSGFYVFRTLMFNCWQTMIKTICLVVFRLAQSWFVYVKLEYVVAGFINTTWLGSIDRSLGSINRKLDQMHFLQNSNLALVCLKRLGFCIFAPRYIRQTLTTF